jgi:hypothetical protein
MGPITLACHERRGRQRVQSQRARDHGGDTAAVGAPIPAAKRPKRWLEEVATASEEWSRRREEGERRRGRMDSVVAELRPVVDAEPAAELEFAEEEQSVHFEELPGLSTDVDAAQEGRQIGRLVRSQALQEE